MTRCNGWILAVLLVCAAACPAHSHETDQYSVPTGREFADLGVYFSEGIVEALEQSVAQLNAQIALSIGGNASGDSKRAARYQSPATVVSTFYHAIPLWINWVEPMEVRLLNPQQRERFPGLVTVHQPPRWIYYHWLLVLDPTKLPRLVRCGTVMVNGVYFGTDKMMHFTHVGYQYYESFRRARESGADEAEATRTAVKLGTGSHPFLSEATWLGLMTTGVWSNADLAVNYVGMLFFRNLTEEIEIGGKVQPPMLVREGAYWRLNDHVHRDVDLLGPFVSDHWNEVLNPNLYGPGIDACVRTQIHERCDSVANWYRDRHLRARTVVDFARIADDLVMLDGVDYGHRGDWAEMATFAGVCLADDPEANADSSPTGDMLDESDAFGRGALWWAAADGDAARVSELIATGSVVNRADIDGETALHAAARAGAAEVISVLVKSGGDVNHKAALGVTPLHVALRAGQDEAVRVLLDSGASADVVDDFGVTPLCIAVDRGQLETAQVLVAHGADPNKRNRMGRSARDLAYDANDQAMSDWFDETILTAVQD